MIISLQRYCFFLTYANFSAKKLIRYAFSVTLRGVTLFPSRNFRYASRRNTRKRNAAKPSLSAAAH